MLVSVDMALCTWNFHGLKRLGTTRERRKVTLLWVAIGGSGERE